MINCRTGRPSGRHTRHMPACQSRLEPGSRDLGGSRRWARIPQFPRGIRELAPDVSGPCQAKRVVVMRITGTEGELS